MRPRTQAGATPKPAYAVSIHGGRAGQPGARAVACLNSPSPRPACTAVTHIQRDHSSAAVWGQFKNSGSQAKLRVACLWSWEAPTRRGPRSGGPPAEPRGAKTEEDGGSEVHCSLLRVPCFRMKSRTAPPGARAPKLAKLGADSCLVGP